MGERKGLRGNGTEGEVRGKEEEKMRMIGKVE